MNRADLHHAPPHRLWIMAARLKTLGLSQVPVLAGSWLAWGAPGFRMDAMVAAMAASGLIQIGTNLWNDAADAASGVDGPARLGPPRVTALGLLPARLVRQAAAAAFGLAGVLGLFLAALGGWPIVAVGLVSLGLGWAYSMGPHPLSGLPVGEALVVAFFGVVAVLGAAHLHGLAPDGRGLGMGLAIGLPAAAVLMLNNHRDRAGDARAGRRTLAIVIGERPSKLAYAVALLGAVGLSLSLAPCPAQLAALLPLAPAGALALALGHVMYHSPIGPGLNRLIGLTALFQMLLLGGIIAAAQTCG